MLGGTALRVAICASWLLLCPIGAPVCGSRAEAGHQCARHDGPPRRGHLQLLQLAAVIETGDESMRFIYTLGCDQYQLVQAVVLDHSWRLVGNSGPLTRIVVGCKDKEERERLASSPLRNDKHFDVFFTEGDLMTIPQNGDNYPARSRPFAIAQWLEAVHPQESIVAILDPDFVFQQPLSAHPDLPSVRPGQMLAQKYDLGGSFMRGFAHANETIPANPSFAEIQNAYATGPPWILHMEDLRKMLPDWGRYTDSWPHEEGLLREQEAFCMAALRHRVPALGQSGLMTSNWLAYNEAWSVKTSKPEDWAPYVLHYCQTYEYGKWYFHKALVADKWYADGNTNNRLPGPLQCGAALLQEPPTLPQNEPDRPSLQKAWMLTKLLPAFNKAYVAYREIYCPDEASRTEGPQMLMRTMEPKSCNGRPSTRYLITVRGESPSWDASNVLEDNACIEAAQTPL